MIRKQLFTKKISLIGAGRAGFAVAYLLAKQGHKFLNIIDKDSERAKRCGKAVNAVKYGINLSDLDNKYDFLIIAVPDIEIESISSQLADYGIVRSGSVIAHLSGVEDSNILDKCRQRGAFVASMHPCMTFADEFRSSSLDCYVALEGDRRAVEFLKNIVKDIGGSSFEISGEDKILYHAGCTIASNYLITLLSFAEEVSGRMSGEIPAESFYHLADRSVENFFRQGGVKSLTGPISRGDVSTVRNHIKALIEKDSELAVVYSILGKRTLKIAQAQGTDSQKIDKLEILFNDVIKEYKI